MQGGRGERDRAREHYSERAIKKVSEGIVRTKTEVGRDCGRLRPFFGAVLKTTNSPRLSFALKGGAWRGRPPEHRPAQTKLGLEERHSEKGKCLKLCDMTGGPFFFLRGLQDSFR